MPVLSLAERILAKQRQSDPEAARQIAAAQAEAANTADAPSLRLTSIAEVREVISDYLTAYIADTAAMHDKGIDGLRKQAKQDPHLHTFDLGRVAHLQNTLDKDGVTRLIRNTLHGPDGSGGFAGQTLNFKFGGSWRLIAFEFDTSYATINLTSYFASDNGYSESVSTQRAATVPEMLLLHTEWLETTGSDRLRYDQNGRLAGDPQVIQAAMTPEAIEAQQQLAAALKELAARQSPAPTAPVAPEIPSVRLPPKKDA